MVFIGAGESLYTMYTVQLYSIAQVYTTAQLYTTATVYTVGHSGNRVASAARKNIFFSPLDCCTDSGTMVACRS